VRSAWERVPIQRKNGVDFPGEPADTASRSRVAGTRSAAPANGKTL